MELRALRYFLAVAEERHFGRAAARLHMTQPPLSRAIRRLETDLGVTLLTRGPHGVGVTAAGDRLAADARALLEQADRVRDRARAGDSGTIRVGALSDVAERVALPAIDAVRARHPGVEVSLRESDLTDPTAGLRAGVVDVAVTRGPFCTDGLDTRRLGGEPMGIVVRRDDPLAARASVSRSQLTHRRWCRLPEHVDAAWSSYLAGPGAVAGPIVRTIQECRRAVLWDGCLVLAPLGCFEAAPSGQRIADALTIVPVDDVEPSPILIAWPRSAVDPVVRSFVEVARALHGSVVA